MRCWQPSSLLVVGWLGDDVVWGERCKRGSPWIQGLLLLGLPWNHNVGWLHTMAFLVAMEGVWNLRHIKHPLQPAILLYGMILAVSLFTSIHPLLSLKFILWAVLVPLLIFKNMSQASSQVSLRYMNVIIMTSVLLPGVVMAVAHAGINLQVAGHGRWGLYAGPGLVSTFLVFAMPILLVTVLVERGLMRYAAGLACLLSAYAAFLTANRAFWLAWLVIMAWLLVPVIWSRVAWRKGLVIGVAIMAILAVGVIAHQTKERSGESVELAAQQDLRPQIWHYWLAQIPNSPWLGHGYGKRVQQDYFLEKHSLAKMPISCPVLQCVTGAHAHNVLIDHMVQTGVLGLLAWLYLLWRGVYEQRRFSHNPSARSYARAGQALVLAMIVKNFTDDFMDFEGSLMFWVYWGVLWARTRSVSGGELEVLAVSGRETV